MGLDTPGGLRGFDLARVVMYADAILMPVCNSAFDRESAAECVAELRTLPRVASGRCRLAAVGMRIDGRTRAEPVLRTWADQQQLTFLGVLRDAQAYVRCIEEGLTLFDLPPSKVAPDMAQWRPILDWVAPLVQPEATHTESGMQAARPRAAREERVPATVAAAPPRSEVVAAVEPARPVPTPAVLPRPPVRLAAGLLGSARPEPTRVGRLLDALAIPRFLQRNS
jgi:hypothetical protein